MAYAILYKAQGFSAFTEKIKRLTALIQSPECPQEIIERLRGLLNTGLIIDSHIDERSARADHVEISLVPKFSESYTEALAALGA